MQRQVCFAQAAQSRQEFYPARRLIKLYRQAFEKVIQSAPKQLRPWKFILYPSVSEREFNERPGWRSGQRHAAWMRLPVKFE
jgi:hypothetical protein